jgi:flavin reductase (DIM6/NTAB) family NADH-FMN oxidoreductase RutF
MGWKKIIPGEIPTIDLHQFILGSVAPRPIAFVSTLDENGNANLAPYSFFNAFSSNPPIVVFSSNRKVADNSTKDTLHNIRETGEAVINVVNYDIVRQMTLASIEYEAEISEFEKSGLTPIPSSMVKPYRVAESPVQMECRIKEIITLGDQGGAGHLIICDVLCMHVNENILTEKGRIDPHKIDLMGRMGRFYYVRASGAAVHEIMQRVDAMGIGFDALPENLRTSKVLTGNEIAELAACTTLPDIETLDLLKLEKEISAILETSDPIESLHILVRKELQNGDIEKALALGMLRS